uniref:Uncharacterized protein n=1 Tax=Anguilla anguilla TaxID=7936 RepID=A0A0E9WV73_ANGAN
MDKNTITGIPLHSSNCLHQLVVQGYSTENYKFMTCCISVSRQRNSNVHDKRGRGE